jgi:hypothetical protein
VCIAFFLRTPEVPFQHHLQDRPPCPASGMAPWGYCWCQTVYLILGGAPSHLCPCLGCPYPSLPISDPLQVSLLWPDLRIRFSEPVATVWAVCQLHQNGGGGERFITTDLVSVAATRRGQGPIPHHRRGRVPAARLPFQTWRAPVICHAGGGGGFFN